MASLIGYNKSHHSQPMAAGTPLRGAHVLNVILLSLRCKLNKVIFLSMSVFLASCASLGIEDRTVTDAKPKLTSDQVESVSLLVGSWYERSDTKDGGYREEIIHRFDNGKYEITFKKTSPNGAVVYNTEVGYWGASGDVYFSIFVGHIQKGMLMPVKAGDPYNYDAYKIIELTDEVFEYYHVHTGNKFKSKKVTADFKFGDAI